MTGGKRSWLGYVTLYSMISLAATAEKLA